MKCPKCKAQMVERRNGQTGEAFMGCRSYPNCRFTMPLVDDQEWADEQEADEQRDDHEQFDHFDAFL